MFYIIFDFCMAVIMLLFGIGFYKSGGKAADYLTGYNMRSADERRKYDEDAMCKAYGKRMITDCMIILRTIEFLSILINLVGSTMDDTI